MFTVYALHSPAHDKLYIGFTSDIEKRLESHNSLATKGYTLKYRPWNLVYTETFDSKSDAMRREKELKSARGRAFIWELIKKNIGG
ncbi:MAG: GIY-YIG nuclease family protein [Cyclobacteriaceae bacterium]|nr:GIY-YIG nuclease family protein [Cyclobacteriaceae bacterium]